MELKNVKGMYIWLWY